MKLLYLWIEKYYGIKEQGFNFSANHKVDFNYSIKNANISVEEKYTFNFYGNKISDVTAIVGENGSGKTTLAKAIYKFCSNINLCDPESKFDIEFDGRNMVYI